MTEPCLMELNKRLIIETATHGPADGGSSVLNWQQTAIVWAALRPIKARQQTSEDDQTLHTSHEVWIRYRPDMTSTMRFCLGLRIFRIQSIRDPDERQRWLVCQTDERRA
jgi:SPP1 family predicted phage head-tail adaptor